MNKSTNYTPLSNFLGALGPPFNHISEINRIAPQWGNLVNFRSFSEKRALGAVMNQENNKIDQLHGARCIISFKKMIQST